MIRDLWQRRHASLAWFSLSRVASGIAMLFIVSIVVFAFTQALPGDIARQVLGPNATEAMLDRLRADLGLDQPVVVQYLNWLSGLLTLDFGTSLAANVPVTELMAARVTNTVVVVGLAALIVIPVAFLLGAAAARRPGSRLDRGLSWFIYSVLSLPEFVVAIVLVVLFAGGLFRWLPPTSVIDPRQAILAQPMLLILPIVSIVIVALPYLTESVRTAVRDELGSDYVRWGRLSGISEQRLLWRYALPNTIAPSLQVTVMTLSFMIGGMVAVEAVFSFPGLGSGLVNAVANRDIVVVQSVSMWIATLLVVLYVAADIVGRALTPKLRSVQA